MASLANQTISSTYDGLVKTSSDNAVPVSGVQALEDGAGNALALSVGRSGNGVTVSGNLAVDTDTLFVDAANNRVGIGTSSPDTQIEVEAAAGGVIRLSSSDTTVETGDSIGRLEFKSNDVSTGGINVMGFVDCVAENPGTIYGLSFGTGFAATATERMRIDSGGNVGIGITPDTKLDVLGNLRVRRAVASTQYTEIESGGGLSIIRGKNNASSLYQALIFESGNNATTEERMRIDSSGNVGVKGNALLAAGLGFAGDTTSAGAGKIELYDTSTGALIIDGFGAGYLPNSGIQFKVAGTERMRITSGGDVSVGTDTPIGGTMLTLQKAFAGNTAISTNTTTASTTYVPAKFLHNGTLVGFISSSTTSTAYNTTSDYRVKENVLEMTGALDRVDALKPSRFNFIADPEKTVDGFLAHEVQAIVPEAVTGEKDAVDEDGNPVYQAIDQSKIVPLLVGAIKELSAKVAALESQLNA